jgi:hypothetical protein
MGVNEIFKSFIKMASVVFFHSDSKEEPPTKNMNRKASYSSQNIARSFHNPKLKHK